MKHPTLFRSSLLTLLLLCQSCSTYRTLDPGEAQSAKEEISSEVDQTRGHYGQPYFLPKGLIHLTIKPEAGSGGDGNSPASANNNTNVITVNTATQPEKSAGDKKTDFGTEPIAYKITVERVLVADPKAGPYVARYEQNWFFAEGASIGVNDDGLLSTVSTTSSDRTAQIISNIEDTAINAAKFAVQGGIGAFAAGVETGPASRVRYKRLNIDITFDPLDRTQVDNVRRLFGQTIIKDNTEGDTILVSPFTFAIQTAAELGHSLGPKSAKSHGLWFRETMPLRLDFSQNSAEFRREVIKHVGDVRHVVGLLRPKKNEATKNHELDEAQLQKSVAAIADAQKELQAARTDDERNAAQAKLDKAIADKKTIIASEAKSRHALDEITAQTDSAENLLKSLNDTAASPAISRTATFVKTIPNPNRVFAFNIARSAFVQNKKIDLTISNGLLTKVSLDKQSEAEGFSEIPLKLAQKVASLPKDLLTVRTEKVTAEKGLLEAQKNALNARTSLEDTTAGRAASAETTHLKEETERIKAETELIKAQQALQTVQSSR